MRLTLGHKLGSCFLLILIILAGTGATSMLGLNQLHRLLEHIVGSAWKSAGDSIELAEQVTTAATYLREQTRSSQALTVPTLKRINEYDQQLNAHLTQLRQSEYRSNTKVLDQQLEKLQQLQNQLLKQHRSYTQTLDSTRDRIEAIRLLMQRLKLYGNFQLAELEDAFLRNQVTSWEQDIEAKWRFISAAYDARIALAESSRNLELSLQPHSDPQLVTTLEENLESIEEAFGELSRSALASRKITMGEWQGLSYAETLRQLQTEYRADIEHLRQLFTTFSQARQAYEQQTDLVIDSANLLRRQIGDQMSNETAEATAIAAQHKTTLAIALGLGAALTAFAIWLSYRLIILPLRQISQQMQEIGNGEGDLNVKLPCRGEDELAQLARSFNHFIATLRATVTNVRQSNHHLGTASESLNQISDDTRIAVSQQQRQTQIAVHAMEEISQTIQQISDHAGQAADASNNSQRHARNSQQLMQDNRAAISQLSNQLDQTTAAIANLADESRKVGSILNVIQGIAEQTNLLALNAAIEAARAGDHGRGFAVVSDEVRSLSLSTQNATEEINQLINRLQTQADDAVKAMELGHRQMDQNVNLTREVEGALDQVAEEIDRITQLNLNIATATEQQAQVTAATRDNLEQINRASEETAAGADANVKASLAVDRQARQLIDSLARFKT